MINEINTDKLYKEIKRLINVQIGINQVPIHIRDEFVSDAFMKVYNKMISGDISSDDYEEYKHYAFITCKNVVLRYLTQTIKQKKNSKEYNTNLDDVDYSIIDWRTSKNGESLSEDGHFIYILTNSTRFSPKEKEIIRLLSEGYLQSEIAKEFGTTKRTMNNNVARIRKKVDELINPKPLNPRIERIIKLLPNFNTEQQELLSLRYGVGDSRPHSIQEIADLKGVTKECIQDKFVKISNKLNRMKD